MASDRTGILIVRLWIEGDVTRGFRARISRSMDSARGTPLKATAGSPDEIYAVVKTWVEAFIASN